MMYCDLLPGVATVERFSSREMVEAVTLICSDMSLSLGFGVVSNKNCNLTRSSNVKCLKYIILLSTKTRLKKIIQVCYFQG